MKYMINFLESLKKQKIFSDIELSTVNEQITVSSGTDCYYLYFTKKQDIFKSNLCQEIMLLNEYTHHIKLIKDNSLISNYFAQLFNEKLLQNKENKIIDILFSQQVEHLLLNFDSLREILKEQKILLLKEKIEHNLPEKRQSYKKIKI